MKYANHLHRIYSSAIKVGPIILVHSTLWPYQKSAGCLHSFKCFWGDVPHRFQTTISRGPLCKNQKIAIWYGQATAQRGWDKSPSLSIILVVRVKTQCAVSSALFSTVRRWAAKSRIPNEFSNFCPTLFLPYRMIFHIHRGRVRPKDTGFGLHRYVCLWRGGITNCPIPPPIVRWEKRPFNKPSYSSGLILVPCDRNLTAKSYLRHLDPHWRLRLNLERRNEDHHSSPCSHFRTLLSSHRSQVHVRIVWFAILSRNPTIKKMAPGGMAFSRSLD